MVLVMDAGRMVGIITDGDLRKAFEDAPDPLKLNASDFMTEHPHVILESENLAEAVKKMKALTKRLLVVVNAREQPVGVLQIFDVAE